MKTRKWVCTWTLLCAMTLGATSILQAAEPDQATVSKLKSLHVGHLAYKNGPITKVFADLQQQLNSQASTAGLQISYQKPEGSTEETLVNMDLSNSTFYDAIEMIAMMNGLEVQYSGTRITITGADTVSMSW